MEDNGQPRVGNYKELRKELSAEQDVRQAHHLNQDAAFRDVIPKSDGIAVALEGDAIRQPGTPHYEAHKSLEEFWEPYRRGGELRGSAPTIEQYNNALQKSMIASGMSDMQASKLVSLAQQQQQAYGLHGNDYVPRVPGRLNQTKP